MRLSHAKMYERVLASDPDCNGRFFMGVLTTGIYCLPSCAARKPKVENIRFFPNCEAARQAGLRPCKKCHPDDFERGADPVLESIEKLVAEIRVAPAALHDARAIVQRSGFGTTRLFELLRQHYHTTPADLLLQARITTARDELARSDAALIEVAERAGFESQSAFHEQFRRFNGVTPSMYREIAASMVVDFDLMLPAGYPVSYLWRTLGRDPLGTTERLEGRIYKAAIRLAGKPALLTLCFHEDNQHVRVTASRGPAIEVHAIVVRLLGLAQDAASFARLARRLGFSRLVKGRENLRLVQTPSVFEGLLWAVIGQQINLPFAFQLRQRLALHAGEPAGDGLIALPSPAVVAALEPEALLALKFSRQKAGYLIHAARLIVSGELDIDAFPAMSATRIERTLLAVRGLGPWSVNYIMMRSLGLADCVPYGDTGLTSGLMKLLELETRPNVDATRRLMSAFSPHRSLATTHLWQLMQPTP